MQSTIRHKTKPKHHTRNAIKPVPGDLHLSDFASTIMKVVAINTFNGIHSLKVDLEPNRVTVTGFCESYYIKQLAQQAIMNMVIDIEIINDIVVL